MKISTKVVHKIIRKISAEKFIIAASDQFLVFRKLLPLPSDYPYNDHIILNRNGINYELNRSDYMQWSIFANFKEPIYEVVDEYLNDGVSFLDIGANIGTFSLNVARNARNKGIQDIQIIAFEPNPFITKKFSINLDINPDIKSFIKLNELACGDKKKEVNLVYNQANSGGGKICEDKGTPVDMVRLDDYLNEITKKRIRFLKIDVEGFEPKVLDGAKQIIFNYRPVIYMEVTDEWYKMNGSNAQNVINSLKNLNYKLMWETNGAFKSLESLPSAFQFNMLCIPE